MTAHPVEELRRVERLADQRAFHGRVFDYLLALWNLKAPAPTPRECADLLPILARWLRAAPWQETTSRMRILTARKSLLCLVHAAGASVDAFLESALGELPSLEKAPTWMRWKLALTASIDSRWTPDLEAWQRISPEEALTYAIAALYDEPISEIGLARFNALVTALQGMGPAGLPYAFFADLCYANFIVSYATVEGKHAAKPVLGEQARRMLAERGFLAERGAEDVVGPPRARPHVAVIIEKIIGGNMMFRCYGRQIRELKSHFEVTLLAEITSRCAEHQELAHRVRYFDPHPEKLGVLIDLVRGAAPDIICYPSVGMTPWTFALSNLRLAPLQVACIGHPAPTTSRAIDYIAVQRDIWSGQAPAHELPLRFDSHPISAEFCFSEQVAQLHEQWASRAPAERVRIAINASAMKLNATFLAVLRQIAEQYGKRVQLRFFPHGLGVRHAALVRRLRHWVPDAEVMEATDFGRYLELLADCDMALQSFPFGGTNTTIDLLALGLPIICLDGPSLHSRIDAVILQRAGLASLLVAQTSSEYRDLAQRLIDDPAERLRTGRLARQGVLSLLREPAQGSTFADALKQVVDGRSATLPAR